MESFVPAMSSALLSWYQLTLENPEYFIAVVSLTGLLFGLIYTIYHHNKRNALYKKFEAAQLVLHQAHTQVSDDLHNTSLRLQQSTEQATNTKEQLRNKETQLAQLTQEYQTKHALATQTIADLKAEVYQSNRHIANVVKSLEVNVGADQPPLLDTDELDASVLWQRHSHAFKQLTEQLNTHQTTAITLQHHQDSLTAQLADQEAIVLELQQALESQNSQIALLTEDINTQRNLAKQEIEKITATFAAKEQHYLETLTHATQPAVSSVVLTPKITAIETIHDTPAIESDTDLSGTLITDVSVDTPPISSQTETETETETDILDSVTASETLTTDLNTVAADSNELIIETASVSLQEEAAPATEKKSWFSPLTDQLDALTGKNKQTHDEQETAVLDTVKAEPIDSKKKSWLNPIQKQLHALTSNKKNQHPDNISLAITPAETTAAIVAESVSITHLAPQESAILPDDSDTASHAQAAVSAPEAIVHNSTQEQLNMVSAVSEATAHLNTTTVLVKNKSWLKTIKKLVGLQDRSEDTEKVVLETVLLEKTPSLEQNIDSVTETSLPQPSDNIINEK